METKKLDVLIDQVLTAMRDIGLKESTVFSYKSSAFAPIISYYRSLGEGNFSVSLTTEFVSSQKKRLQSGNISARHFRKLQRAANILREYNEEGCLTWRVYREPKELQSQEFKQDLNSFTDSLQGALSGSTIYRLESMISDFLNYLAQNGCRNLNNVSSKDIRLYIIWVSVKNSRSMGNIIYALRKFWRYANEAGLANCDVVNVLTKPAGPFVRVLPCYTKDEARELLSLSKTDDHVGKRNYAIILLALHTGLRSVDIFNLKLADIDWRKNEINIIQRKTGTALTLPLHKEVGGALADYILNHRPNADSPYVFIRSMAPATKLSDDGTGMNILKPYLKEISDGGSNVDGKGFHALRRSVGTWLIESGSDVPTAAQVLGHKDHNSSKRYISLHGDGLKCCCMSLSGIETTKEGLI